MFTSRKNRCPLCQSGNLHFKYQINRYSSGFNVDECGDCGFIFMNPPFTEERIRSFYSEEYFKGKAEYSYMDERDTEKYSAYVWRSRVNRIRKFVHDGNFLDIGCSFGGLLETASEFYEPYGIELSPYASVHAKKRFGDKIHNGTLADHPFPDRNFSAITMIELIEHLEDPAVAVEKCYRLLREEGVLVIQTANMNGRQAKVLASDYEYFMPGHLSYFTAENLRLLLKSTGFRKIKIYYPVEFGLIPKLLKSRGGFKSISDYRQWIRISLYHIKSLIHFGNFAMTSSMVVYAVK